MFTRSVLISTLAGLAAAAPTANPTNAFAMIAVHSGNSIVHQQAISAYQEGLWINEPTQAYCPPQAGGICADTQNTTTIFTAIPDTAQVSLSMDVYVPGGQQAYVAPGGAVKYTVPHSGAVPPGSSRTGFEYSPAPAGRVGKLSFEGLDFWACPNTVKNKGGYEVFAAGAHGFKVGSECISIVLGTASWDGKTAYEYN